MTYRHDFYIKRREQTRQSAVRIFDTFWTDLDPDSVLDVGCATGTWLCEAKRRGSSSVLGVDGSWVPREHLEIDESEFLEHNLAESDPPDVGTFDLALCVEVAEHLPSRAADRLIAFLTSHANTILFSAAIPGQGGTGHVNEQLQSYWCKKFNLKGYECVDLIRPQVWTDPDVNVIYKQNMFLYVHESGNWIGPALVKATQAADQLGFQLDRVHPDLFKLRVMSPDVRPLSRFVRKLISSTRRLLAP